MPHGRRGEDHLMRMESGAGKGRGAVGEEGRRERLAGVEEGAVDVEERESVSV